MKASSFKKPGRNVENMDGDSKKSGSIHWEKYRFVMTILDPTENYFHIDNKRILLITIKQIITSERSERIPC